jgi:hypothetical protein
MVFLTENKRRGERFPQAILFADTGSVPEVRIPSHTVSSVSLVILRRVSLCPTAIHCSAAH